MFSLYPDVCKTTSGIGIYPDISSSNVVLCVEIPSISCSTSRHYINRKHFSSVQIHFSASSGFTVPLISIVPNALSLSIPYFFSGCCAKASINLCATLSYNTSSYSLLVSGFTKWASEFIINLVVDLDLLPVPLPLFFLVCNSNHKQKLTCISYRSRRNEHLKVDVHFV